MPRCNKLRSREGACGFAIVIIFVGVGPFVEDPLPLIWSSSSSSLSEPESELDDDDA